MPFDRYENLVDEEDLIDPRLQPPPPRPQISVYDPTVGEATMRDQPGILITDRAGDTRAALDSGDYNRVVYAPSTWQDRQNMAQYAGADPSLDTIDLKTGPETRFQMEDAQLYGPGGRRGINIPNQPSDNELNYFDELSKFRKVAQQQIGIDPDAEYKKAFSERIDSVMRNYNSASRALLTPQDRVKIEHDAQSFATQRKEKAVAQLNHEMGIADQAFKIGWDKQQKEREAALNILKAPTDDQRLERELTATLGHKPTDAEFNAEKQKRVVEIAGAKAGAVEKEKGVGGFTTWTPEAQKQAFMTNVITKETPASVKGLGGNDRKAYAKAYSQWQVDAGFSPQDIALMQADYRAGDVSLKNMAKQEGPMDAFVGNINKQIAKVKQLYNNNDRTGLRLLDLPIRELKTRALGSGEEAVKASYLLEISNEIGKLSSGASASVQQLSDSAKEDWKKVHDVNLSMKDIMTIVNATRDQANMRMESWREAKQGVRQQLGAIGVTGAGGKTIVEQRKSPDGKKTYILYSDGSREVR